MPEPSILDARLAEIDRRLRTIQSGLAPAAKIGDAHAEPIVPPDAARADPIVPPGPAPIPSRMSEPAGPPPRSEARPPRSEAPIARLEEIVAEHERLLAAARELLASSQAPTVVVSAGPFAGTEALKRFERSLAELPEVRDVVVREYEGDDRAIVDVHLFGATS